MMKILLLTGESGVGKTTISKKLCEDNQFHEVLSFSTRQPRNADDRDHFYIDKEDVWDCFLGGRYCSFNNFWWGSIFREFKSIFRG